MTEIARRPAGALAVDPTQTDWTPDQRAALDSLGIDDTASAGDLRVFLSYAQRTGLDPFARQIYLIGRNTKENINGQWRWRKRYTIQVGIDGFRVIANRTGKYRGQVPTQWCGANGRWRDVWLSNEPPAAARVGVVHVDFAEPLLAVATLAEYGPRDKDGALMGLWPKMPALMLAKVAEALALRKAFPNDLSGVYIAEEMDQSGPRPIAATPARTLSELIAAATDAAGNLDGLRAVWREAASAGVLDEDVVLEGTGEVTPMRAWLTGLMTEAAETSGAGEPQYGPGGPEQPVRSDPAPDPVVVEGEVVDDPDPWATPAPEVEP